MFDSLLQKIETDINISDLLLSENAPIAVRKTGDIVLLDSVISSAQMDQIIDDISKANNISRDTTGEMDIGFSSSG